MRTRTLVAGLALLLAFVLSEQKAEGRGQTPPGQVRDAAPLVGTGIISGVVMTDEPTPRPIRRASVALAFSSRFPLTTVTDDAGRFVFAELPAGNYSLIGSKPAWVSTYYGAKTAGHGPGVPIALLDGQRVTGIVLKLMRGATITGVVRRPNGQPAPALNVQVSQVETIAGNRRMSLVPTNMATDDRGMYRIFGLAPGDYVVQVGSTSFGFGQGETRQVSEAEVRWADQIAAATAMTSASPPPAQGPTVAYATVFYPGTADASAASVVTIGPGEERTGVDFTISMVPTAHISGTVLDENGQPFSNGTVNMLPTGAQPDQQGILILAAGIGTRSGPNGTFSIANVTPGQYTLRVRATPPSANGAAPANPMLADLRMLGYGATGAPTLWAETSIAVEGRDITDVVLRLQPGMTVTGKIVYDGTAAPPADITQTRFGLAPPPTGASAMELLTSSMFGGTTAKVAADGTFALVGMTPGKYRANVAAPMTSFTPTAAANGPWTLKSAIANGRDIADVPLEIRPNEDVSGLVVTFTDRPTELSGSVIDAANRPVTGFPILVFSTDRTYWTIASRRIQQTQPASDGRYTLTGLPPGEYFVCAVTSFTPNQLYDPAFLESIVPGAFKITLGDGEKKRQDLKLAGGPGTPGQR